MNSANYVSLRRCHGGAENARVMGNSKHVSGKCGTRQTNRRSNKLNRVRRDTDEAADRQTDRQNNTRATLTVDSSHEIIRKRRLFILVLNNKKMSIN